MSSLLSTYNQLPVYFERGEGVWLFDNNGKKYLDCICGIGVTNLGHHNDAVINAIQAQAEKILHVSNLVNIKQQEELADKLCAMSGISAKAFFCNSGAESLEAAIKFSRLYGHSKNIDEPKIVVMTNAFHGRTLACISASDNPKIQKGFEPLVTGFIRAEFNNIQSLEALSPNKDIVSVILEPIQGEGGIAVPNNGYLTKVREICDKNGWLMIVDEVQSGMARTGKFLAFQHEDVKPDAITLAKGLANGVPIGAFLVSTKYADLFKPGSHGSTFGGNPLSCSAAVATLNEIEKNKLYDNAKIQGTYLLDGLKQKLSNNPHVKDIRGKGLMIGIELDRPCRDILPLAFESGLVFNITRENTVRLLPSLIFTKENSDTVLEILPQLIEKFTKG